MPGRPGASEMAWYGQDSSRRPFNSLKGRQFQYSSQQVSSLDCICRTAARVVSLGEPILSRVRVTCSEPDLARRPPSLTEPCPVGRQMILRVTDRLSGLSLSLEFSRADSRGFGLGLRRRTPSRSLENIAAL